MCLIDVVVRILTEDDCFDGVKWSMSGPGIDILRGWEDCLSSLSFLGEESFEFEEVGTGYLRVEYS